MSLCPVIMIDNREAAANSLDIDYIYCCKGRNP